ncbi:hypothetical protein J2T17_004076 [Paenibacillus mucilaginosus]|uniref:GapA-binding peptide SR1P n=1 Tax=Paenibacillus mucilaginosus TaxID=61624 RepID=UPI003D1C7412
MNRSELLEQKNGTVPELGTIVCKHCEGVVDTLPTRRVQVIYGECEGCRSTGLKLTGIAAQQSYCS